MIDLKDPLEHTKRVQSLINDGKLTEATRAHNEHLKDELRLAELGEVINLSDLMAAKEVLDLHRSDRGEGPR